ncbi:MAG: sodium:proton antiporter [Trueperaceae bacterium]|nr:sodium:proton antiporter [Trueperaceae bacterium]
MIDLSHNAGLAIAVIIGLGMFAQWLAWRIRIPAILPLLLIGFLIGPIFGLLSPSELIGNEFLFPAVSLAVGLILFEGGMTLRLPEIKEIRSVVRRLITIGAIVTWLGSTLAGYFIGGLELPLALLFGALIIVTGPTVIGPLIRNVRPTTKIANVLKWEGILIDPVGALIAVLVFEYLLIANSANPFGQTLLLMLQVIIIGSIVGTLGGFFLSFILRRHFIPDYLINLVALALVFATFALSNELAHESGLLATTLMGMIVANRKVPNQEELLSFKETLSILFISMLFIVLAANVSLDIILDALSWRSLLLILVIMLVVRPLNIFISSVGSSLNLNEKLFLSWIAPRGIVAASVSSLFVFELNQAGTFPSAGKVEALVFLVIVGTVVLNGLTAKPLATWLRVAEPDPQGFLIMGAHPFARSIASFLKKEGFTTLVADTNWANIATARVDGLNAYYGSLLSSSSDDEVRLSGIGRLLALTSNDEANALAALKFAREFGSQDVFQLQPSRRNSERKQVGEEQRGRTLFNANTTYASLSDLFNRGAKIKKTDITEQYGLDDIKASYGKNYIPMFVINGKKIRVLSGNSSDPEVGSTFVYLVVEPNPSNNGQKQA